MAKIKTTLVFQDTASFEANLGIFATYLVGLDADLAAAIRPLLAGLSETAMKREDVLNTLMAALVAAEAKAAAATAASTSATDETTSTPVVEVVLSRICAAPSARLGHLAFEGQGAFASQC